MSVRTSSTRRYDAVIIGSGVMGATTALMLGRAGLKTALVDRRSIFREASGVNAGTLTLHMIRAGLIPHAMRGREMWLNAREWLGRDVGATATPGLSLAFTPAECELVEQRATVRREMGAPIEVISGARAREIEPGANPDVLAAAYCPLDGFIPTYVVGQAYARALAQAGVDVLEDCPVSDVTPCDGGGYDIVTGGRAGMVHGTRVVFAGGVWLQRMLAWLGLNVRIRCLINQLVVTERMPPVMNNVISIANGLLSLKQFQNGTVLIGGGWQGEGNIDEGGTRVIPENLQGNVRLARHTIPRLDQSRIVRVWLGLESETDDAMPIIGSIPTYDNAFVIGCVHSGFTSGPYMGALLARHILGEDVDLAAFDIGRFTAMASPVSQEEK
ncbi:NAD(P)/FAD-dependent oxidoreductase [Komagataeibacter melomenusus]